MASLGKYELVERIGAGGMAEIWRGRVSGPSGFEKTVAIKRILPHLLDNEGFLQMFISEAKLVARLQHPNIVQLFDFEVTPDGEHFITMEYVHGCNLSELLRALGDQRKRISPDIAMYIAIQMAAGLGYAHQFKDALGKPHPIIHRDISPHNVLLSGEGAAKIVDFGIAKIAGQIGNTQSGVLKGKITYMSPEQASGRPLDHRSDLFSLGIVLFQLLIGKRPWASNQTDAQMLREIVDYTGPNQEDLDQVDMGFGPILRRLLNPDPDARYQTALEVEAALSETLTSSERLQAREELAGLVRVYLQGQGERSQVSSLLADDSIVTSDDEPTMAMPPSSDVLKLRVSQTLAGAESQDQGEDCDDSEEFSMDRITGPSRSPEIDAVMEEWPEAELPVLREVPESRGSRAPQFLVVAAVVILVGVGGWVAMNRQPAGPVVPDIPLETPVAAGTPRTTLAATPRPKKKRVVPAFGKVSIYGKPWVEVWVDGKRLAGRTPVKGLSLSAGEHKIGFKNSNVKYKRQITVTIQGGKELKLYVDAEKRNIKQVR